MREYSFVGRCANRLCTAVFRRFGEGRLFVSEARSYDGDGSSRQQAAAWLCDRCSRLFTVTFDRSTGRFIVRPAADTQTRAAS